ncbi:hypothetical protein GQ54DRAFT_56356 [Martensiomyces pterosporus]|nr:hypothetical protein GQ54DRAFT_56356 [Martensiomyces pterosporus]
MSNEKPEIKPSAQPSNASAPKPDVPATRLFKILNPELYMKPNRWVMYGGVLAMAGIVLWLGSGEMRHRQEQRIIQETSNAAESKPRAQTYQERMAELKRSSE